MKDQYVYLMGRGLYVNLTNRCSNRCDFCVRNYDVDPAKKHGFAGYDLWLDHEPSAQEVIDKARGALQKLGFGRGQLHWEGLHNLIDDARVAKKYNTDKASK